jgi:hypothetical protein
MVARNPYDGPHEIRLRFRNALTKATYPKGVAPEAARQGEPRSGAEGTLTRQREPLRTQRGSAPFFGLAETQRGVRLGRVRAELASAQRAECERSGGVGQGRRPKDALSGAPAEAR